MSLLNQVLQDLEKRNAENVPEQHKLSSVKAIPINQGRSYYFPFAVLCIIAIIIFNAQKTHETDDKRNIVKQSLAIPAANNIIKKTPQKKQSIPETVHSVHKAQAAQKTIPIQDNKLQIKLASNTSQKTTKEEKKDQTINESSDIQKAEHYFSQAEKQHHLSEKQKKLELAIQLNPQHINARLLLINTLLQQGLTIQSAVLLDQSLKLFPQNLQFITLRSQLFLQKKQAKDALNILHHVDESYIQDVTYLSLLAAAYQQNDDNFNSLKTYQKLVKINPQKAEYWLGLAITQENQNQPHQALEAYQQALHKNTLKPAIVGYIKERISILK